MAYVLGLLLVLRNVWFRRRGEGTWIWCKLIVFWLLWVFALGVWIVSSGALYGVMVGAGCGSWNGNGSRYSHFPLLPTPR